MQIQPVDQDDLNRVLDNLTVQHGNLEVFPADPSTGSVRIVCQDGTMFRFTTQSRLIFIGKGARS